MAEIVTLGETMIRLSTPDHELLELAETLQFRCAGAESNVAVNLARLGRDTAWVSRLVDDPLGRKIAACIRAHGVDTSGIVWATEGRTGLYFIEAGAPPRPTRVIYDRHDSAMSRLRPEDVDWGLLDGARLLHLTGITPALSAGCAELTLRAAAEAAARGVKVSCDINYRAGLWSPAEAARALPELLEKTDVLIAAKRDLELLFSWKEEPRGLAARARERFGAEVAVITLGEDGALACDGEVLSAPAYPAEAVDRIGAGDAFTAGFLHGYLKGDLLLGLRYGNALAALNYTSPGDIPCAGMADIERVISGGPAVNR